jgi:histone-lysine N-methyltransferase SETMAR
MECQVENNEHIGHCLLYEFSRGSKAAEAARNICAVYGEDSIAKRTAQKWFSRFKQGNFDMSVTPRSGRPCCASGGVRKVLFIMNCLRGT